MNPLSLLQKPCTKLQATEIISWVGSNQNRFNELFKIFIVGNTRIVQRAAWPLSYCVINHPKLIDKYYKKLILLLDKPNMPAAIRRNILRIFDQIKQLPKAHHGAIMDACFRYIEDPNEAIAAQAFALGILSKLSKVYPEIKPELYLIIENRMENATPAFTSRAKKILSAK